MKLYHNPLSGHAHRAQLFLSLLGVPHELVHVDFAARAHKEPDFLAINAFGQIPVLDDDGVIINDSAAILVYLARNVPPHGLAAGRRALGRQSAEMAGGRRRRNSPTARPRRGA